MALAWLASSLNCFLSNPFLEVASFLAAAMTFEIAAAGTWAFSKAAWPSEAERNPLPLVSISPKIPSVSA
tara:strand:- start:223 stop:432 length:210 start_codon:yes stop_codon:yes gene_type:complete